MGKSAVLTKERTSPATKEEPEAAPAISLNGSTRARFVLFAIPPAERVDDGPLMRGQLETEQGRINVAGWKRVARDSGNEYLSLKVGITKPREPDAPKGRPDEWLLGPFYGRLFKQAASRRRGGQAVRYFGFIEHAERVSEDPVTNQGQYKTLWQLHVKARPSISHDGRTHYIDGSAYPPGARPDAGEAALPF
jgi:hypothetical protein